MSKSHYDYIIAGAGCAGLSLAYYISNSSLLQDKSILIIDKQFQKSNDRTWCFWEPLQDKNIEKLISKKWNQLNIANSDFYKTFDTFPFSYNKINGIDFYTFILERLRSLPNITFLEKEVSFIGVNGVVSVNNNSYTANYIFNSILPYQPNSLNSIDSSIEAQLFNMSFLWQHFIGYKIKFDKPILDSNVATWMDFRVEQHNGTAFMYVLPENPNEALFEYTMFSKKLLDREQYFTSIKKYVETHFPNVSYSVLHTEEGVIPMSVLNTSYKNNVIPIGTLGGAVKASTGFAFSFIQKQTKAIVKALEKNQYPSIKVHSKLFTFFDKVLIRVLAKNKMNGSDLFTSIFKSNNIDIVLKFLSNTSSWKEDLKIMSSLPKGVFFKCAIEVFFKRD